MPVSQTTSVTHTTRKWDVAMNVKTTTIACHTFLVQVSNALTLAKEFAVFSPTALYKITSPSVRVLLVSKETRTQLARKLEVS